MILSIPYGQPVSGNKSYSTESTTNKGLNLHSPQIELVVKLVGFLCKIYCVIHVK